MCIPYHHVDRPKIAIPDRPQADDYERPPIEQFRYVPDIASRLGKKTAKNT